jgi:hypothetical protein
MLINEAPLEERDYNSTIWQRQFADISKALQGEWGSYTASLASTTNGTQTVKIRNKGATATIQIKIEGITSTGVLTLPYSVEETILNVWDFNTQSVLDGALVNGNLITLPNVTGSTSIMITGEVIKWIQS